VREIFIDEAFHVSPPELAMDERPEGEPPKLNFEVN